MKSIFYILVVSLVSIGLYLWISSSKSANTTNNTIINNAKIYNNNIQMINEMNISNQLNDENKMKDVEKKASMLISEAEKIIVDNNFTFDNTLSDDEKNKLKKLQKKLQNLEKDLEGI